MVEKFGISTLKKGATNDLNLSALGMGGMSENFHSGDGQRLHYFVNEGVHKSYSSYA